MRNLKFGLLSLLAISFAVVSCTKDEDQITENTEANATRQVSQEIIDMVGALDMNSDFVEYRTFYFPDGSTEERLYIEDDIVISEEQLRAMAAIDKNSRQYRTNALVSQGRNISIIGYTGGGGFGLSNKERTALQWAVNNYNRLGGVNISFTLTFGTGYQNKDMVVYHNPNQSGSGGSAGFPSNGLPNKFVQIYGLAGYSTNVNEHVITHEIGHSVGFRHTDWFSRQSCGQNVNEGSAGVGAVLVNGTPSGYDSTSIMLACFSSNEDGEFNNNDITALNNMY